MGIARYNIERMLPEEFEKMDNDKAQTIKNCFILPTIPDEIPPISPTYARNRAGAES